MILEFCSPHPSGVGVYLTPPQGHFRIWRTPETEEIEYERDELGDTVLDADGQPVVVSVTVRPVLQGFQMHTGRRFLDWDTPLGTELGYRLEVSPDGTDGSWVERGAVTFTLEPEISYSAFQDGGLDDVTNPRDALVVFLSVRLAQLARQGALYVRSEAHRKRYRVTASHEFNEAEVPIIGVNLGYGTGGQGDLGWNFTEERLKLELIAFTHDKRERDSLTRVMRGLIGEISWFLEDLGCSDVGYGELTEGVQAAEPYGYVMNMAIGLTAYTFVRAVSKGWQMVPHGGWISM